MRRFLLAALGLAAATGAPFDAASAQESPGSPLITAGISQTFTADSNFRLDDPNPGGSFYADTRIQLGLLSETKLQTLALGLDTGLRALWEADRDFDLTFASPSTARLAYARDWASGGVDVGLRYRQTSVDADRPLADFLDPDTGEIEVPDDLDRLTSDITERRYDANVDLELATDSPSSYEISVSATRFDYDEATTDTTPRSDAEAQALWRLRLTPVLSGAVLAAYSYFEADNTRATLVRDADVDLGVIYQPSDRLRLDFGLGYARYQRRETIRGVRDTDELTGPVARAGLRYAFEDVTVEGEARYSEATEGAPFTGNLRATYPLPRGLIVGRVFQTKGGSSSGNEVRVTGAGIGIDHEINQRSNLGLDLTAARQVDEIAPFEPETTRYGFTAVYSHAVTAAVAARIGYRFRSFDQEPDQATSNAVFFEIGRTFSSRP